MDFGALPPEVNSAQMYAGPGPGPLLAAAAAWQGLAGELSTVASAYQAAIADLIGQGWLGPASESMAAAATPYADWLGGTAGLAEHTASRMMLAVGNFEQAFAATVPPPAIAANRSQLATLVASDVFGQNATAIAATEAEYGQMWLQDATAMYGYAARSAAATAVQPFTAPPSVVNPAGSAGQGAAAAQGTAGGAQNQLSQLLGAIPHALQGLSTAGGAPATPADPVSLSQAAAYIEMVAKSILPINDANISVLYGMGQYSRNLNTDLDISKATGGEFGFGSGTRSLSTVESTALGAGARPMVTASSGSAEVVGKLAVPQAWTESVPEAMTTTAAAPAAPSAASAAPASAASGGHGAGMAVGGLAGRAAVGRRGRLRRRREGADPHTERAAGELTGAGEVRHWYVEPGGLKGLLGEVSGQPGVHEVYFDTDDQAPLETGPQPERG